MLPRRLPSGLTCCSLDGIPANTPSAPATPNPASLDNAHPPTRQATLHLTRASGYAATGNCRKRIFTRGGAIALVCGALSGIDV